MAEIWRWNTLMLRRRYIRKYFLTSCTVSGNMWIGYNYLKWYKHRKLSEIQSFHTFMLLANEQLLPRRYIWFMYQISKVRPTDRISFFYVFTSLCTQSSLYRPHTLTNAVSRSSQVSPFFGLYLSQLFHKTVYPNDFFSFLCSYILFALIIFWVLC
jgi:hypothetical protein